MKEKRNPYENTIQTVRDVAKEKEGTTVTREVFELWRAAHIIEDLGNNRWHRAKLWFKARKDSFWLDDTTILAGGFFFGFAGGIALTVLTVLALAAFRRLLP